jgi:DNA repair protein RadD
LDGSGAGMLTLRPYQAKCLTDLYNYFTDNNGDPLAIIPTGGGKSLIMAEWCKLVFRTDPQARILVVTHVRELVAQNYAELKAMWPDAPAGIYSAGLNRREIDARLLFASIQSIYKRAFEIQQCDMVLVDEAHLIPARSDTMYRRFLDELRVINPHLKIIGFTATPFRLDSGMLHRGEGALFGAIAHETNVRDLIDQGFLSRPVSYFEKWQIDTAGVGTRAGDFIASQLEVPALAPEAIDNIVSRTIASGNARKGWLVFGCTVAHCQALATEFQSRGISTATIFGDTPAKERAQIIANYKSQKIRCLVSMGVLTTGFNAKHVDLIVLARPTKSTGLYIQMVGRGTRLATGKENCLILDFGGNISRHGPFDDPNIPDDRKKGAPGDALVKYCPQCEAACAISLTACPECGHEFPPVERKVFSAPEAAPIMSLPPEWLDVDHVSYSLHEKPEKPVSLKVSYRTGMVTHHEWICLGHGGYARTKAEAWWLRHACAPVPKTAVEAMMRQSQIRAPDQIRVKKNGKFTEVVATRHYPQAQGKAA